MSGCGNVTTGQDQHQDKGKTRASAARVAKFESCPVTRPCCEPCAGPHPPRSLSFNPCTPQEVGEESRVREGQAGIKPKPVQAKCLLPVPAAPRTLTGQAWFQGEGREPSLQHLEVTPVARICVHQGPELHQTPPHLLIPLPGAWRRGEGVLSRRAGGQGSWVTMGKRCLHLPCWGVSVHTSLWDPMQKGKQTQRGAATWPRPHSKRSGRAYWLSQSMGDAGWGPSWLDGFLSTSHKDQGVGGKDTQNLITLPTKEGCTPLGMGNSLPKFRLGLPGAWHRNPGSLAHSGPAPGQVAAGPALQQDDLAA